MSGICLPPLAELLTGRIECVQDKRIGWEDGFRVYQNGGLQMTLAPNVVEFTPATCIGGFKVTAYNVGGESSSTNTVICHSGF